MRQPLLILLASLLLLGCSTAYNKRKPFSLEGAWILSLMEYPFDQTTSFPNNGYTYLRIYEGDSVLMQSQLTQTVSAMVIQPQERCGITLINKGGGEMLYLEDDDPCPLTVKDDTTIIIQRNGILHTWHRADHIAKEWGGEIRSIFDNDLEEGETSGMRHYVLSAKERRQASFIHWLYFSIALLVLIFLQVIWVNRREKQRL